MIKTPARRKRVISKFASLKLKRTVNVYSALMRDLIYLLEYDREIINYRETEQVVFFQEEGIYKPFRFDFDIEFRNKKQLAYIYTEKTVYSERVISLIEGKCFENSYEFVVFDKQQIHRQPYLNNIKLLYRYARQTISVEHNIALYNYFSGKQIKVLRDFKDFLQSSNLNPTIVYTMLFHNLISTDLHQPLTDQSILYTAISKTNLPEVQTL